MTAHGQLDKKKVLIVNSYHKGFEWVDDYTRAIKEVLGQKYSIHSIDMDTKRIPESDYAGSSLKVIQLYDKLKPSIVLLGDDNALRIVGPKLLSKNAEIVFLGINNNPRNYFNVEDLLKMHGVLEQPLILRSITLLEEIFSNKVKKAVLQYDACKSSDYVINNSFHGEASFSVRQVTTHLHQVRTLDQWKKGILRAKDNGYDALFAGFYYCIFDKKNKHVDHDNIIKWSVKNSKVPIFAFWDFAVGENKAIGGYVISGYEMGKQAALIAKDVLNGKKMVGLARVVSLKKGSFLFSRSGLKKWNIKLPQNISEKASFTK
jgi:hypothetical protein